jgi:5-formyltetrahydrofolate cyclo-ligase
LLGRLRRGVPLIGVAYDEQVVTQLPVAPHDRPVDVVITPSRTLRTSRL